MEESTNWVHEAALEIISKRGERDTGTHTSEYSNKVTKGGVIGGGDESHACDVTSVTINISHLASEWFSEAEGRFTTEQFDNDLGLRTPQEKANRRKIFERARLDGLIRKDTSYNNVWHIIDEELEIMLPHRLDAANIVPFKWAFGIEDYVKIYAGDLIVGAGSKDAGKTALVLDFLFRNKDNFECWYLSSEIGEERLYERLSKFECDIDSWKNVNFRKRKATQNWADVIRPNAVNIVDFMELYDEFYKVAKPLAEIHSKLKGGNAIVLLQKSKGAEYGRGREFTLEKASLAFNLDNGLFRIVSGKSWVQEEVNPAGMTAKFKLVKGCNFQIYLPLGHHEIEQGENDGKDAKNTQ